MVKCLNNDITAEQLKERLQVIRENICKAAFAGGHDPDGVDVMAVTKYVGAQAVVRAIEAGVKLIGENREQSLREKIPALPRGAVDIHFIGHLQRNKAASVVKMVSTVQSLDSLELASVLDRQALLCEKKLAVLVEVNIGRDPHKSGIAPEAVFEMVDALRDCPNLTVRGLMTILPLEADEVQCEKYFSQMNGLYVDIRAKNGDNVSVDCLSMGMSSDYRLAVKHGATLVRIGTSLFES